MRESARPHPVVFWAAVAVGWAIIAFGVWGLLDDASQTHPDSWTRWFVGSLVVHDALFAPVVYAAGVVVAKVVPERLRKPVQVGLLLSGIVLLLALPFLRGYGLRPDNPTLQPRNYVVGTAVLLGLIWTGTGAAIARRLMWRRSPPG